MPVRLVCPNPDCQASFSVSDAEDGQLAFCPKCGQPLNAGTVRGMGPSPPPAPAVAPPPNQPLIVGTQFAGRYHVESRLGGGGMGAVYLAEDRTLGRRVAIKIPYLGPGANSDVIRRFQREARAAAKLEHPHICPVFDVGVSDGIPYLTMAFIEGKPLTALVKAGPSDPRQTADLVRTVALAMEEAHRQGIVHRDLKPENIMISPRRGPIIMDFGLARMVAAEESFVTRPGSVMGTPAYMPPEQIRGDLENLGPRSDVYSLGVILYALLAGQAPFHGRIESVLYNVLHTEPKPLTERRPGLDPRLETICLKAMAKSPDHRFQSMADFAAALNTWLTEPVSRTSESSASRSRTIPKTLIPTRQLTYPEASRHDKLASEPPRWRRYAIAGLGALGAMLALGLVLIGWALLGPTPTPEQGSDRKPALRDKVAGKSIAPDEKDRPDTKRRAESAKSETSSVARSETEAGKPTERTGQPDEGSKWARLADEGDQHTKRHEYEPAIMSYTAALALAPDELSIMRRRGHAHLLANELEKALSDLDEVIKHDPQDAESHALRGWVHWSRGRPGKADLALEDAWAALQVDPVNPIALAVRGLIHADHKDWAKALADVEEAIEHDPGLALTYLARAYVHEAQNEWDSARDDCDQAVAHDPEYAPAYLLRGLASACQKDWDRARGDLNQALKLDPQFAQAHAQLGVVEKANSNPDRAAADFDRAIQIDPNDASLYVLRGSFLQFDRNDRAGALADYSHALELDPNDTQAKVLRDDLTESSKAGEHSRTSDSKATTATRLESDATRSSLARVNPRPSSPLPEPTDAGGYNSRGLNFSLKRQYDQAIADFTRAIRLNPKLAAAYHNRGLAYWLQGDFDQAIADFTQSIQLNPRYVPSYEKRAQAYRKKGDLRRAQEDEAKARQFTPTRTKR